MLKIVSDCTACGACEQICPQKCITLCEDENGFMFPKIDKQNCINCGMCDKACHLKNAAKLNYNQKAYAVVSRKEDVLNASTSGGAFTAIADVFISNGGVVYGCAYDENIKAKHIRTDSYEQLRKLNGSKYVQSEIGNTYRLAKKDLDNNKKVLFSGTPCQIAGLRSFLGKDYANLLTVDIICHGVASHAYFKKFIDWYKYKNSADIQRFDFRSKENSGWSVAGICTGARKNGKTFSKKLFYFNSYYYYYYLAGNIYRESCYNCKYANLNRPGDFTLGDLWGAEGFRLPFSIKNGCSLVIVNSSKAAKLLKNMDAEVCEISLEQAAKNNEQLNRSSSKPESYHEMMRQYRDWSAEEIHRYFIKNNKRLILKGRLKYIVPVWLRNILLSVRYKL